MLNGAFALLGRSLRIDARSWSTHLGRLGLMGAIYCSLCFALTTQNMFGAPGLRFFEGIAYLDVAFMTLLGIGFFSTAITEEKEEDTLGLMLMAGISPLGILAGKSGGRLWQALLLIAIQYPFVLLAVTMGGVAGGQIWAVTVALLAYMVMLAGFGLLCSTIAPRSRTAGALMIVGLIVYFVVPSIAQGLLWFYARWLYSRAEFAGSNPLEESDLLRILLDGIGNVCIFLRCKDILATGFNQSPWSLQVISNSAAGLICAGLSWLLFGLATRNPSTEASSRGLVARRRMWFGFTAGRAWNEPFVWKDFHFVSGGLGMMLIRVVYFGGFGIVALTLEHLKGFPPTTGWIEPCFILMSISVAIDAGLVLARSLHDEVRSQTLSSLMMLPRSSNGLVYAKFAGALLGWIPGPIIELGVALNTASGRSVLWSIAWNEQGGWAVVMLFVLIPHFAAFVALYVRWGAVPLAIGMTIGVYFAIVAAVVMGSGGGNPGDTGNIFFVVVTFLMLCLCGACHIGVLLRVQALGAK